MKVIPKVNTEGFYLEDIIVDDSFTGVVPFYDEAIQSEADRPVASSPTGYLIGIPVPQGLYHPRFNLSAWHERVANDTNSIDLSSLWIEGLSEEEIDELVSMPNAEPTELEKLKSRLAQAEANNELLEEENSINQLALMELHLMLIEMQQKQGGDEK